MTKETSKTKTANLKLITAGVIVVSVLAGGGLSWVNLSSAGDDREQASVIEQSNATLAERVDAGQVAQQSFDTLSAQLADLRANIPSALDQEGFFAELSEVGATNAISIDGLTLGDATPFEQISPEVVAVLESVSGDDAAKASAAADAIASADASSLVAYPVTVTATGDYDSIAGFISGVQYSTRLFWVNGIDISEPEKDQTEYTVVLSGDIFVLADADIDVDPQQQSDDVSIEVTE